MQNLEFENAILNKAWDKITPTWPLQNIIACNPIGGFENLEFEEAIKKANQYFAQKELPKQLEEINRITIKWCQVFFDQGQATIKMPGKEEGFYEAWKNLVVFDDQIHKNIKEKIEELKNLPTDPKSAILECLRNLKINKDQYLEFTILMLTSLSGWASYVKYLGQWSYNKDPKIMADYLAIRMIITRMIWDDAKDLLTWHKSHLENSDWKKQVEEIKHNELEHNRDLLNQLNNLKNSNLQNKVKYDAQLVFCIDVRSEQFRRSIESLGNYQTFGFAGFFGIPTSIENDLTNESYPSCPVLLSPKHVVREHGVCSHDLNKKRKVGAARLNSLKKYYQALKYNFTTPIPLAEGMGMWSGLWMLCRTAFPKLTNKFGRKFINLHQPKVATSPNTDSISFEERVNYAAGALKTMGLIKNFSDIVIFCGHGSATENNAYATSLDCGACGGRQGGSNAKILAKILNEKEVRESLKTKGIEIPQSTIFIGAIHNTTTDEVELYDHDLTLSEKLLTLKNHLVLAGKINRLSRAKEMGMENCDSQEEVDQFIMKKSYSWSETRPEWGLARNAAFIVAPRNLTKDIDLSGRAFLHSYDWQIDEDNSALSLILNAPMVVAQWINSQYLFSTINNIAYGSGSKITANITGKIGVMQGNGSDLMNGLSMQSVYMDDKKQYHKPARLMTFVYAPSNKIDEVILKSPKLEELFKNQWVKLYCLDPRNNQIYKLDSDLNWLKFE